MTEYMRVLDKRRLSAARCLAVRWQKNGDHPDDNCLVLHAEDATLGVDSFLSEGKVVRYFRVPGLSGTCSLCSNAWNDHGWIEPNVANHLVGLQVCPGDWVVTFPTNEPKLTQLIRVFHHSDFLQKFELADESKTLEVLALLNEAGERVDDALKERNAAYRERNALVCALSKCFPSFLISHQGDDWDPDWRNIVLVMLPSGQATWHIHDSELIQFSHLMHTDFIKWDGHDTATKYERLARLPRMALVGVEEIKAKRGGESA